MTYLRYTDLRPQNSWIYSSLLSFFPQSHYSGYKNSEIQIHASTNAREVKEKQRDIYYKKMPRGINK